MDEEYVRTIGSIKKINFQFYFDEMVAEYKAKAIKLGYDGKLKFKTEKDKVIVFAVINKEVE